MRVRTPLTNDSLVAESPAAPAASAAPSAPDAARRRRRWLLAGSLAVWGPGMIVMLADGDAGCLITAAQSGAQWGYRLILPQRVLIPVLDLGQEMTVRLGVHTGLGHGALIRREFGRGWAMVSAVPMLVSAVGTLVVELGGDVLPDRPRSQPRVPAGGADRHRGGSCRARLRPRHAARAPQRQGDRQPARLAAAWPVLLPDPARGHRGRRHHAVDDLLPAGGRRRRGHQAQRSPARAP